MTHKDWMEAAIERGANKEEMLNQLKLKLGL